MRSRPADISARVCRRHYEQLMAAESVPEIRRTSLAAAVLALKALPLDIDVLAFDFLDQPEVCVP